MNLLQLVNLCEIHLGEGHDHAEVLVLTEDAELHRTLSLNWDPRNGHFVICTDNDVEEP
jgi:hypothetical protein